MNGMWAFFVLLWTAVVPQGSGIDSIPVNVSDSVITGRLGSSLVLPCWLDPAVDATTMEIRWYRPHNFGQPVLFYQNQMIKTDLQEESYRNRSSLALRDMQSAGLKGGDLSLRLENLNTGDEGPFHCYVSGDTGYGSAAVTVSVYAPGSPPVLSIQSLDNLINVSCSSCGWHPQPSVEWTPSRTTPGQRDDFFYTQGSDKLTCVQSWALFSPSDSHQASCSLFVSKGDKREGIIDIQTVSHLIVPAEDGAGTWVALFVVALLLALAMAGVSAFFYRKYKSGYEQTKQDEEALHTAYNNTNMEDLRKDAVSIMLDSTKVHRDVVVNQALGILRDRCSAAENHREPGFPYRLSVRGDNRFTSGRAYWEVGLTAPQTEPKQSWLIGVTNASHYLNDKSDNKSDFTPLKGFWFLCSDKQTGLCVNTEPEISLPLDPGLETVGVLLDYEEGELSFYNANKRAHLFTMKTKFSGQIVPLFNPGIGDKAPLTVINCTKVSTPSKGSSELAETVSAKTNDSKPVE